MLALTSSKGPATAERVAALDPEEGPSDEMSWSQSQPDRTHEPASCSQPQHGMGAAHARLIQLYFLTGPLCCLSGGHDHTSISRSSTVSSFRFSSTQPCCTRDVHQQAQ